MTGKWPKGVIDHIDGIKSDNRWDNLRDVTKGQNAHNSRLNKNNKSGHTGVSFRSDSGKWRAIIRLNGKLKNLGQYDTAEDAVNAREKFEREFLSDFFIRSA
jgi:hypothetical protein